MGERTLAYMPVAELTPALVNPKGHALDGVDASLTRFGYMEPVMVDERTGRLVAGHGRIETLIAREAAGQAVPDGVVVDGDGQWTVPVVRGWSSETDDEAHAAGVALNRLTELGGWEEANLASLLGDLAKSMEGLSGTGFDATDLEDMLLRLNPPTFEDLRNRLGDEPTEEDMWPLVRFKLAPGTRDELVAALGDEGTDDERMRKLLARLS